MRARVRRLLLGLVTLLFVLSVPWYRDPTAEPQVWLGLPDWVAVALACYAAAAVLNAVAWLLTDLRDDPDPDDG
jgi:hypothetical protein